MKINKHLASRTTIDRISSTEYIVTSLRTDRQMMATTALDARRIAAALITHEDRELCAKREMEARS